MLTVSTTEQNRMHYIPYYSQLEHLQVMGVSAQKSPPYTSHWPADLTWHTKYLCSAQWFGSLVSMFCVRLHGKDHSTHATAPIAHLLDMSQGTPGTSVPDGRLGRGDTRAQVLGHSCRLLPG